MIISEALFGISPYPSNSYLSVLPDDLSKVRIRSCFFLTETTLQTLAVSVVVGGGAVGGCCSKYRLSAHTLDLANHNLLA